MDTESIYITPLTLVEVEFRFTVQDIYGRKCPALIRYQYPLYFKDYFLRSELVLAQNGLVSLNPRFTKDTLYNSRKSKFVSKTKREYPRFWGNLLITFSPDYSSLPQEEIERLSKADKLKAVLVQLPVYVRYDGDLKNIMLSPQQYDYPLGEKWDEVIEEMLTLHKWVNKVITKPEYDRLWYAATLYHKSICIIDSVIVPKNYTVPASVSKNLVLEFKQYKSIPGTTKTYRIDAANTNTMTQKHIHVFYDGEQIYAMNVDGTPHDGSKCVLSKKDQKFLKDMGFTVPQDGILELYTFKDGSHTLLCD